MNTIFLESFAIRVQIAERKPHTHHNENHQIIKDERKKRKIYKTLRKKLTKGQ